MTPSGLDFYRTRISHVDAFEGPQMAILHGFLLNNCPLSLSRLTTKCIFQYFQSRVREICSCHTLAIKNNFEAY